MINLFFNIFIADGRKVLRSSIREFLCSEAMHALGIPTTRAGSVITSDTTVERDPLYNGNNIDEKCTIVSRIAENFFRFGSFEIFKSYEEGGERKGPSAGNEQLKKQLLDYMLLYYPDIYKLHSTLSGEALYMEFYKEIVKKSE